MHLSPEQHIAQPHDKFFRSVMSDKRVAREFLEKHLPADVLKAVNLDKLEMQRTNFIDDARQESIADVLFKTELNGKAGYLYLLVDHQSTPDELMPFRVLKYQVNIIDHHLKTTGEKRIPLIVPLVVYHGTRPWNFSTNIADLVDAEKELKENYLLKPFSLIDINLIKDEELKQRIWTGIVEFAMKHIFERNFDPYLIEMMRMIVEIESQGGTNIAESVLVYIVDRGEIIDKGSFVNLVKSKVSDKLGEKIMTLAQQFKDEGIQQGIQQGMQQGKLESTLEIAERLLRKNGDIHFISEVTGLPLERIKKLNTEICH